MNEIFIYYGKYITSFIGGASVAIAGVSFIVKKLVDNILKKDLANYQDSLLKETERLKHSLSIHAHERNIKNTRVDNQRSQALVDIYKSFAKLVIEVESFSCDKTRFKDQSDRYAFYTEKVFSVKKCLEKLEASLMNNAIYVSPEMHQAIMREKKGIEELFDVYIFPDEDALSINFSEKDVENILGLRDDMVDIYKNNLSIFIDELIQNFRKQLGIV
ncbi:hypothetical protein [Vibrio harveyi]|uniref:hypothetical protein n=1 Tax=Vibrio harveyi TaxID=669 RepID=UPI0028B3ABE4|nr:hypothetical protein [Vibrio harveyi]